jgi:hypothetical protein
VAGGTVGREQECRAHAGEARTLSREHGLGLSEIWSLAALGDLDLGHSTMPWMNMRFSSRKECGM